MKWTAGDSGAPMNQAETLRWAATMIELAQTDPTERGRNLYLAEARATLRRDVFARFSNSVRRQHFGIFSFRSVT